MNYGQRFVTLYRDQDHPHGKEMEKNEMAVWGGLTNSCEKKSKRHRRKERYKHLNAEFQRIARRDKKAFLSNHYKEIEENNKMGKVKGIKRCKVPVLNKSHGYKVQHCECSYIAISGAHTREKHPKTIASGVLPLW